MPGNDDNGNIEINVNGGGNGMSEGTVTIARSEYEQILELAYKAAMLKEAVLNTAALDFYGKDLYLGGNSEVATIFKYAFPEDYEGRLRELMDKKKEEDGKEGAGDGR